MLTPAILSNRFDFFDDNNTTEYVTLAVYTHSTLRTDDVLSIDVTENGVEAGVAKNAGSFYYLKDGLGSITDIVTEAGAIVQSYVYNAFGQIRDIRDASNTSIKEEPVVSPHFAFTNREYDSETGMYYYRARYYEPTLGRFIQVDPHPGSLNLPITLINKYIYAGNNPVMNLDPTGKSFLQDVAAGFVAVLAVALIVPAIVSSAVAGITSVLAKIIVGAIIGAVSGAAIGALAGGATHSLLGGSFSKGAKIGAEAGAISGAFAGALAGFNSTSSGFKGGGSDKLAFNKYMCGMHVDGCGAGYGVAPTGGIDLSSVIQAGAEGGHQELIQGIDQLNLLLENSGHTINSFDPTKTGNLFGPYGY